MSDKKTDAGMYVNLRALLDEAGVNSMDLVRSGIAPATAYNLVHNRTAGITFDVLEKVCDFFTKRLGRPITPGDVLLYTPKSDSRQG